MIGFIIIVLLVIGALIVILQDAKADIIELRRQYDLQHESHLIEKEKIRKDSTFRSSAVSWGNSIENFVPFMDVFPIPPEDVNFLGKPIDYIGFTNTDSKTNCEVHFIEVKSGNASLSVKQRNIKKAIQEGRVRWHEVRVEANKLEVQENI